MSKINYLTPKGDDFVINLVFLQSDGETPASIVGSTIDLLLKADKSVPDDDDSVIAFEGVITDGAGGIAYVEIPHASATLEGTYYYKLIETDSGGIVKTFAYGVITFSIAGSNQAAVGENALTINMGSGVALVSTYQQDQFTATASQVLFTLTYTARAGSVNVFKNGIKMQKGAGADYTETGSLSSITFTAGLDSGDKVEVNYVKT